MRATKRVLIGSLAAASVSASLAVCTVTPSISKITRPGLTRATHNSGVPLPEPMRTSAGFFDTGTSGKTRIQTRPARFMCRVSARRAASIWRAVTRSGSSALRPNWPNDKSTPDVAIPLIRPLCALRNFVRFGCSMATRLLYRNSTFPTLSLPGLSLTSLSLPSPTKPFQRSGRIATRPAGIAFRHLLVLRHRVVLHDLTLEDPDFDAASPIGRKRGRNAVVDIGTQRMERHASLAIPFHARDFRATQAARTVDTNATCAKPHRRLHRALHGAPERDATFQLL